MTALLVDVVESREEAMGLRAAPLVIRQPLERWLDVAGLGTGRLEVERIGAGMSNATFRLSRGGDVFVLRRPPRPPVAPSAHDVLREALVLEALRGTRVPTPHVLATCADERVIGAPFYVMDAIEGTVVDTGLPPGLDGAEAKAALAEALVDALVAVHEVDWRRDGLASLGRPRGYLERQLRTFARLWERNRTRPLPLVGRLHRQLARELPACPRPGLVHGDFRLANVMFAPEPPVRVAAVLDWEMATVGDPLVDVGLFAVSWVQPGDPRTMFGALTPAPDMAGFPARERLLSRYAERSGRSLDDLQWYCAFALWKTAIIMEGNYRRFRSGGSSDVFLSELDHGVPALIHAAYSVLTSSRSWIRKGP